MIQKTQMTMRMQSCSGQEEWYTPPIYLQAAREVLGGITLDPASSVIANRQVKARRFYTREDDGLSLNWRGRVWLNPPYKMPDIERFAKRFRDQYEAGVMRSGILLTNNATDTAWWHYVTGGNPSICFTRGRISFMKGYEGVENCRVEKSSPTHGQTFFYFGKDHKKFQLVFSQFGLVLKNGWR